MITTTVTTDFHGMLDSPFHCNFYNKKDMIKDIKNKNLQKGDDVYFTKYGCDTIHIDVIKDINTKNVYTQYNNYTCRMRHHLAKTRIVKI